MEFAGFHGTSRANEGSIKVGNFYVSANEDEWLGTGTYFFIDGVSDPLIDARNWAKLQAYDKETRQNSYSYYSVLKAKIIVDNVLALDTNEGIIAYNVYRDYVQARMKRERIQPSVSSVVNDCEVCNHILENSDFDAIINLEYIQLDRWSRVKKYRSRVPTCRIISVKEPKTSIDVNEIEVVERKKV